MNLSIGSIFGTYSGIITSIGLIIGMYGGNLNKQAYIIGLISIELSDSFSDAFGIYNATGKSLQESLYTFIGKMILRLMMIIPFLLTTIKNAVLINLLFGTIVLCVISYKIYKNSEEIVKNITLTCMVIGIVYFAGSQIQKIENIKFEV